MGCCVFQIIFAVSFLMLLLTVSGSTNGSEPLCVPQIKVVRNTVFKAPVMKLLKINCTATQHHGCHTRPRVFWCRIYGDYCKDLNHSDYLTAKWKEITQTEWMFFLVFHNISMEDAGLYRCRAGDFSVSHTIKVNVTDVSINQTNTILDDQNLSSGDDLQWLWPYVYICSGTAALVLIIIAVTLLIIRSQGLKSTRKDVTTKNQYIEAARSDLPPPPVPQPRQNSRSSDQQSSVSYRGCETPPVRGTPSAGRSSDGSRNTAGREQRGEENVLVYASLNHQAMPRGPRRAAPREPEPEPSEYAAIRFR